MIGPRYVGWVLGENGLIRRVHPLNAVGRSQRKAREHLLQLAHLLEGYVGGEFDGLGDGVDLVGHDGAKLAHAVRKFAWLLSTGGDVA